MWFKLDRFRCVAFISVPRRWNSGPLRAVGYAALATCIYKSCCGSFPFPKICYADSPGEQKVLSRREQRFRHFASIELNGTFFMTTQDFIDSIVKEIPNESHVRKSLSESELEKIVAGTTTMGNKPSGFFQSIGTGVITYPEYLFLITILTKSRAGLEIALKIMDTDGDQYINKDEFLLVQKMISPKLADEKTEAPDVGSSLLVYLFGTQGNKVVHFNQFFKFLERFQEEVWTHEILAQAHGKDHLTEMEFSELMLSSTVLTRAEQARYLKRMDCRIENMQMIGVEEACAFFLFLSNIDDFLIALRMLSVSDQAVGPELFSRAVLISTGQKLSKNVIDVVFKLFDVDGDGKLSHKEFVHVLKDRLRRGFGKYPDVDGWKGFVRCVKKESVCEK